MTAKIKVGRVLPWLWASALLFFSIFPSPAVAGFLRQSTAERVERLLAQMTVRQQVGQLFMVSLWGPVLTEIGRDFVLAYAPGGMILFDDNTGPPEDITALTNAMQQTSLSVPNGVPLWIAIDQEGGVVSRLSEADGFTTFPAGMAVAATGDPAVAYAVGQAVAEELRAVGINMNLAPVADLETNPDNPVIARRAFGSDPQVVGPIIAALIEGMQSGGVLATAKHFPGHGDTGDDSHLGLPVVPLDRARLEAVELAPFRSAIRAGVGAIMAAHVSYPALDPTPDTPASLSAPILTDLLRREMGFGGLIMTDALDMDAIDRTYSLAQAAVLAIQAGADLITPGPHAGLEAQRAAIEAVIAAVENGAIPPARITESARRVLTLKAEYGVLDWTPLDPSGAAARVNHAAHATLVADVLARAVTLVYDRGNFVPLDARRPLALIYPATHPSLAFACQGYDPDLRLVGVSEWPTAEEVAWAVGAAARAEVTVAFTSDADDNPAQQALVNALPPETTVVAALRSPYDWLSFPCVAAYLTAYTLLPPTIPAVCAALFGAQPISGALPVSLGEAIPAGAGVRRP